ALPVEDLPVLKQLLQLASIHPKITGQGIEHQHLEVRFIPIREPLRRWATCPARQNASSNWVRRPPNLKRSSWRMEEREIRAELFPKRIAETQDELNHGADLQPRRL